MFSNLTKTFLRGLVFFLALVLSLNSFSQTFKIQGVISGYGTSDVKLLKKLKKDVHFEGPLKGVKISVSSNGYNRRVYSTFDGSYEIEIPSNKKYTLEISKDGYSSLVYYVDSKRGSYSIYSLNGIIENGNANSFQIGTYTLSRKWVSFKPSNSIDEYLKSSNVEIANKSVKISNIQNKKVQSSKKEEEVEVEEEVDSTELTEFSDTETSEKLMFQEELVSSILISDSVTDAEVDSWQGIIDKAKEDLKLLNENSDEYRNLQIQITLAEQKLKDAKQIIELKNAQIENHRKVIVYLILFLISILLIAGLIYYFYGQIKSKNAEIVYKSEKIRSSIEYASLIQKALLNEKDVIQNVIPNSFLFYKPKDVVSGDFYWYKKINGKIVIIASDCTGHGVPGALITMLGISALDNIVLHGGELTPSKILLALEEEITEKLKDDNPYQLNGMDIAICVLDEVTNELSYNGAMREIVIVDKNNELQTVRPELASIAAGMLKKDIKDKKFNLEKGSSVFMFSDGYQDQFKGNSDKVETYNFNRFNDLLKKVHQTSNFDSANNLLEKELKSWMTNAEQTDDILLLGFRV